MKTFLTVIVVLILLACSSPDISGTETTNGPAATFITVAAECFAIEGTTDSGAEIICVSSTYIPFQEEGFSDTLIADNDGEFRFESLSPGRYTVTAYSRGERVIVPDLVVSDSIAPLPTPVEKEFGELTTVSGRVTKESAGYGEALVYLRGTPFYALTSDSGTFHIDSVPADVEYLLIATEKIPFDWKGQEDSVSLAPHSNQVWENIELEM